MKSLVLRRCVHTHTMIILKFDAQIVILKFGQINLHTSKHSILRLFKQLSTEKPYSNALNVNIFVKEGEVLHEKMFICAPGSSLFISAYVMPRRDIRP